MKMKKHLSFSLTGNHYPIKLAQNGRNQYVTAVTRHLFTQRISNSKLRISKICPTCFGDKSWVWLKYTMSISPAKIYLLIFKPHSAYMALLWHYYR